MKYSKQGDKSYKLTVNPHIKNPVCPLCKIPGSNVFFSDRHRDYFQCRTCCLIFVPPDQFLSADDEKAEYDLHENIPGDPAYRRFLNRLFTPIQERIQANSRGLDFGSGPGPTLSLMFEESGYLMEIYDKFYAKNSQALEKQYDFITATEVVEHLHNPEKTLARLWGCLKTSGWFGIMTKLAIGKKAFAQWHYKNDLTHVCFFSRRTFAWLAGRWQADLVLLDKDVILFNKPKITDIL
ncbi:MAG: class I SAM-dependent methyltransferase [Desulfobacteraceae bacterium]|nr:class I SAM-dependent methyltransferase [Desulfobacteraceae bacterium]MBC2755015.1 class I SAM-dependent methyltransferase [Desulfobacteraceae bacterium]